MLNNPSRDQELEGTNARPFRTLSEEQEGAIQRWRTGGLVNKEGLVITFFSLGVLLVALLLAIRSL